MPVTDQLLQAFKQFGDASQEYGIATGIRDATAQVQKIKDETVTSLTQKYSQQKDVASALQGRMASLGASGQQIANAVGAVAPPDVTSVEGARQLAATAKTPADAMEANRLVASNMKAAGDQKLAADSPMESLKNQHALELQNAKLEGQKEMFGLKGAPKATEKQAKALTDVYKAVNNYRGNSGMQQASKDLLSTAKINEIAPPGTDLNKLTDGDIQTLYGEVARFATGAAATDSSIAHMLPNSYKGVFQKELGKLGNNPTPAQQGEFVRHTLEYVRGAQKAVAGRLYDFREEQVKGYEKSLHPEDLAKIKQDNLDFYKRSTGAMKSGPSDAQLSGGSAHPPDAVAGAKAEQARRQAARAAAAQGMAHGGMVLEPRLQAATTEASRLDNGFGKVILKSNGGAVPGKAKQSGDSKQNDTVPAMLSPGEIVIPRSVVKRGADAIRDFAKKVIDQEKSE